MAWPAMLVPAPFFGRVQQAYLFGSRAYGTATLSSDYDIIAVLDDWHNTDDAEDAQDLLAPSYTQDERILARWSSDQVDITCVAASEFTLMLRECRHDAMQALFAPAEHVWLREGQQRTTHTVDHMALRRMVPWEAKRRFNIAAGLTHL